MCVYAVCRTWFFDMFDSFLYVFQCVFTIFSSFALSPPGVALLRGAGATCSDAPGAGSAAPGLRAACIHI